MKYKLVGVALALVVLGAGLFISLRKSNFSGAQQDKIAALKELRDSGVITAQEYDAKVRQVEASAPANSGDSDKIAALKELRDSGVITAQEYDTRAEAIKTSTPAAYAAPQPVPVSKLSSGVTRQVEVTDPVYSMTAYTLQIPADWKFAGAIARPRGCHGNGAALKFTAQSADGLSAVVVLPTVAWSWVGSESLQKTMAATCPVIDISTAASFLLNIAVPNIHPNAKVVAVLPLDSDDQATLKGQLDKEIQQNASMGNFKQVNPKWTLDGARVRVQYDRDGHPVEEMMFTVIHCNEQTMPALPFLKQAEYRKRTCSSRGTILTRAPHGHLDEMLALPQYKLNRTLHANAEWQNRMAADQQAAFQRSMDANNRQFAANLQHFKEQGDQRLAQGRAFQQSMRQSTDRALAADRSRQAAIDASAHATALYSLDRQEFRNPNTGQIIEASNQYNHQWMSSDGSALIQTNDHTFDPNGQVNPINTSWTELVAK